MPPPSKISLLPEAVRDELDEKLIKGAFSGYYALADWLKEQGYDIEKTAIHKHGQRLKKELQKVKNATQSSLMFADAVKDDAGALSAGVMALVQTKIFELMVDLEDMEEAGPEKKVKLLGNVAHSIADISRASISQKKWSVDLKARAEAAATAVESIARTGGLSAAVVADIRREILGIAA